jgi:hypothetical protein
MSFLKCFKIGFIGVALLLLSCNNNDVIVLDSEYVNGSIGTSKNTGAVEFNFTIQKGII